MKFLRLFFPLLFCGASLVACHEKKTNDNVHIRMEDLAGWNRKEYSLSSRKIREAIEQSRTRRPRMYADSYVSDYYASHAPFLWITRSGIDERADTLLGRLRQEVQAGIPESAFHIAEIQENLARIRTLDFDKRHDINTVYGETEYLLTQALARYACGQRFGYVRPETALNRLEKTDTTENAPFRQLYAIRTEHADKAFFHQVLAAQKDGDMGRFLQSLHPDNALYHSFVRAYRQAQSPERRRKAAANIERCRWRTPRPEGKYVWVNLAGACLRAVDEKEGLALDMKICIGSPGQKTPMLHSQIERVDMNPYWNIPYSIVKREIAPRHAGDEAYFSRNRYRILDKETGEELPPAKVTAAMLTSGNYRVRQDNGDGNSLGRLIFRFPNDFSIFLHDTNNKRAFQRRDRAISHGCIRVEKPLELAVFLLDDPDDRTVDRIREAIGLPRLDGTRPETPDGGPQPVKTGVQRFKPPVPLFIEYYTLYPLSGDSWEEFPDPYGYDEVLLKNLEGL